MKNLIAIGLALVLAGAAQAQSILRNSITTNVLGTNLVWNPSAGTLTISGIGPSFALYNTAGGANNRLFYLSSTANRFQLNWSSDNGGSSLTLADLDTNGNFLAHGYIGMSDKTNRLTIANDQLLLDGVPVTSTAAAPVNNFWSTNNFFISGKGNTLIITQVVQFAWTTLTMSGSNVSAMNLTNSSFFKLTLTNDAFMVAPINFPGTNFGSTFQVHVAQDGTGGRSLTLTNGSYVMAGSGTSTNPVASLNTNASAVSVLTFVTSPFTSSKLYGVVTATGQ